MEISKAKSNSLASSLCTHPSNLLITNALSHVGKLKLHLFFGLVSDSMKWQWYIFGPLDGPHQSSQKKSTIQKLFNV